MSKNLDFLKTFLECISVAGVISSLIPDHFIKSYPFWAGIINSIWFKGSIILLIILIYIYYSIKENKVYMQFRLKNNPEQIFIKLDNLRNLTFEIINLSLKKSDDKNYWIRAFSFLRFKLFISFQWPQGMKLVPERIGLEFEALEPTRSCERILMGALPLNGRYSITVHIAPEIDTGFDGGYPISIKFYVAPWKCLNNIVKVTFSEYTIDIS